MCSVLSKDCTKNIVYLHFFLFFNWLRLAIGYFLSHSYTGAQKFMREYTHLAEHSIPIANIRIIEIINFLINSASVEAI